MNLSELLAAALVGTALGLAANLLDVLAGNVVRDLDGHLIPARLTDAELVALRGGVR